MNEQRQSDTEIIDDVRQKILPLFKVILHNDDFNSTIFVTETLMRVFRISVTQAEEKMWEAHKNQCSIICIENFEVAEFHRDCLHSYGLTSTIEPA